MQTFLPYDDFERSAKSLDYRRLGKQRVECLQILNTIFTPHRKAWQNHPAVNMWRGYENALCRYGMVISQEWINRGYNDNCFWKFFGMLDPGKLDCDGFVIYPPWLGGEIHETHRSNLIRKNPAYYLPQFANNTRPDLPYYWPV